MKLTVIMILILALANILTIGADLNTIAAILHIAADIRLFTTLCQLEL